MAKIQKSLTLKNCVIDMGDMTVTEYEKDNVNTYCLKSILTDFDGVEGLSIVIRQSDDLPSLEDAKSEADEGIDDELGEDY